MIKDLTIVPHCKSFSLSWATGKLLPKEYRLHHECEEEQINSVETENMKKIQGFRSVQHGVQTLGHTSTSTTVTNILPGSTCVIKITPVHETLGIGCVISHEVSTSCSGKTYHG